MNSGQQAAEEVAAMVGHELRTPLTVLYSCLQLLARTLPADTEPRAWRYLNEAMAEARQMNLLTGQLLDAASARSGKLSLRLERLELGGLARRVVEQARSLTRGQQIALAAPSAELRVEGDRVRLEQVLLNLLLNAISYAPGTDRIDVRLRPSGTEIGMEVQDYGPGLTEERLAQLTEPFSQEPRDDRGSRNGLGLGLFLCQELARLHRGRLDVSSALGRGSTFTVWLPLLPAAEQPSIREDVAYIRRDSKPAH